MTKKTPKRFLIDCDGVLADFDAAFLRIANQFCESEHLPEHVLEWDYKNLPEVVAAASQAWEVVKGDGGFCQRLEVLGGSDIPHLEAIQALRELGEVRVVTTPVHCDHWYYERVEWLIENFGFRANEVTFTKQKEYVYGTCLVDDKVDNVVKWTKFNGKRKDAFGVLWARPYNVDGEIAHKKIHRTNSWQQVLGLASMHK